MMDFLTEPIFLKMMAKAFIICLVLTAIHGYLGFHVIARTVIFVDLAMAQIAAMGKVYALYLGFPASAPEVYFFSLGFTLLGAFVISVTRMQSNRVPHEAIIGIIYACSSAIAILLLAKAPGGGIKLKHMLVGNILAIDWPTIGKTVAIYTAVAAFHWIFREKFFKISLHFEQAQHEGMRITLWDFLFYATFGIVITSSVDIAGVLLVFSFLVIPATIALLFAQSNAGRIWLGWAIGTLVSALGVLFSFQTDNPSGPSVVAAFAVVLILAGIIYYLVHAEHKLLAFLKVISVGLILSLIFYVTLRIAPAKAGHAEAEAEAAHAPTAKLRTALRGDDATQKLQAIDHLRQEPMPALLPELLQLLRKTQDARTIQHLVEALSQYEATERIVPALARKAENALDPDLQLEIGKELVRRRSPEGMRILIAALSADVPPFTAQEIVKELRAATGRDFGYDPLGDDSARNKAIDGWRAFWKENQGKLRWSNQEERFIITHNE